jgi:hypothetical protein
VGEPVSDDVLHIATKSDLLSDADAGPFMARALFVTSAAASVGVHAPYLYAAGCGRARGLTIPPMVRVEHGHDHGGCAC